MEYPEEGKKELPCMKRKRNGSLGPLQQSVTLKEIKREDKEEENKLNKERRRKRKSGFNFTFQGTH